MKTLHITQLFAQANTYCTPSSRERERRALDQATAAFLKHSGTIEELPTYTPKPLPARRRRIDPETVLHRQRPNQDAALEAAAVPIIQHSRLCGTATIRTLLREAGMDIRPRQIELIAARHGISLAGSA